MGIDVLMYVEYPEKPSDDQIQYWIEEYIRRGGSHFNHSERVIKETITWYEGYSYRDFGGEVVIPSRLDISTGDRRWGYWPQICHSIHLVRDMFSGHDVYFGSDSLDVAPLVTQEYMIEEWIDWDKGKDGPYARWYR